MNKIGQMTTLADLLSGVQMSDVHNYSDMSEKIYLPSLLQLCGSIQLEESGL